MNRLWLSLLLAVSLASATAVAQERLVIAQGTDAVTLDAPLATDSPSATVLTHIVETLFELTPEGTIEPMLVESYEFSEDGLTLTLNIRQGINFHDGTPLNAEAVKFNIERLVDPDTASPFAFLLAGRFEELVVADEHTLEMRLTGPFGPLLAHLTHNTGGIQSPTAIEEFGEDYGDNPVGTGPYRFDSWERGERLDLIRNDDYWGDLPPTEAVRFLPVSEGTTRMALVEAGEAHVAVRVPPPDIDRLEANPDIVIDRTSSVRTIYKFFNHTKEPFDDVLVRRAINHAVDKEAIAEFVLGGVVRVSDAAVSPGVFGYAPVGTYEYDPELARELLAEAGYEDGFSMSLHSPAGRYLQDIQITEAIQSQLADVGIDAEIETLEFGAYLDLINFPPEESVIDVAMLGWGTVTGDADYGLYALFHSSQWAPDGFNNGFYSNTLVDELLEEARSSTDPAFREQLYADILELLHQDAAWLFLHSESQITAIRSNVEGFIVHPTERYLAYRASLD